ncbi:MAG TPA: hypothetical protein PKE26_15045 [Kiritimatiellia bacterium]|nr:hypothetical protein [Kiritimatiellia bacterium]HMP00413.1 hypothetical protein [Kiritimatiellia bacterium]HMP97834.1 hypothetical protein [Kiritimatiellia bacterium]
MNPSDSAWTPYVNWRWLFDRNGYRCAAGLSVALAFFFALGAARHVVSGVSAYWVVQHAGLDVITPLSHPLWGWAGRGLAGLPGGIVWWNLLSAISAALICGWVFLLTGRLIGNHLDAELLMQNRNPFRNLAGFTAAVLLAFSAPFRIAAAMAHPVAFDMLLLLTAFGLLMLYWNHKRLVWATGSMFFAGLAVADYPIAVLFTPLHVGLMAMAVWRNQHVQPRALAFIVLGGVAGLLPLLIAARQFLAEPTAQWLGLASQGDVLWAMAREYAGVIRHTVPRAGQLIIVMTCLFPLAAISLLAKNQEAGSRLWLLVLAGLAAWIFFHGKAMPWPMFGLRPLLIMPYVLAAIWAGCVVSYGFAQLLTHWYFLSRRRSIQRLHHLMQVAYLILLGVFLLSTGWISHRQVDLHSSRTLTRLADQLARQLQDHQWLLVDEGLEPLIRIKLAEQNKNALVLSASRWDQPVYQRSLASSLNDARLVSMAEMGLIPLLREVLNAKEDVPPLVSVMGDPALLRLIPAPAWPDRMVYASAAAPGVTPDEYLAMHQQFWDDIGESLLRESEAGTGWSGIYARYVAQLSRVANDAGVWLIEQHRPELARLAFEHAIRYASNNVPARLNLREVSGKNAVDTTALAEEIEQISASLRGTVTLPQLIARYGSIHHPDAYRQQERLWRKATAADYVDAELRQLLDRPDKDAYAALLARDVLPSDPPGRIQAMLRIMHVAIALGRIELAAMALQDIRDDLPEELLAVEAANLDMLRGDREAAYQKLSRLPEPQIKDPRALAMLALLTVESRPFDCDRYLDRLETFPGLLTPFSLPLARLYLARGNEGRAIRHLEHLLEKQPLHPEALRLLLRLRLQAGDAHGYMPLTRSLLTLDARDALANYALAKNLIAQGRGDAARAALRASIENEATPEAHHDLAALFAAGGDYEHARFHVEAGLVLKPDHSGLLALKGTIPP